MSPWEAPTAVSVAVNRFGGRARLRWSAMRRNSERGQMLVIITILLPVLLGALALGVDVSVFYFEWAELQKAADASALAGAGYLPGNPDRALETAQSYAEMNGIASSEITSITIGSGNSTLRVELSREVPYYFGRVLGLRQSPVVASATAAVSGAQSATGILPVGIDSRTSYTFGQPITLMQAGPNSSYGPGNWGALALGEPGASTFESNVINGYDGTVNAGALVATQTGEMEGPTTSAFQTRIDSGQCGFPDGSYENHSLNDPRAVTVPIVNFSDINGKSQVPVEGFARIWLVGVDQHSDITAIFLQEIVAGGSPGGTSQYGGYEAVLIQ